MWQEGTASAGTTAGKNTRGHWRGSLKCPKENSSIFVRSSSGMGHRSLSPCGGRRCHFKFSQKRWCLIWVLRQPLAHCIRHFLLHVCYLSGFSFYIIPVFFFVSGLAWEDESWWVELAKRWCKVVGRLGHSWLLAWESAANLEPGFYPSVPRPALPLCTIIKSLDTWKWELFMKWWSTILLALLIVNTLFTKFLLSSHDNKN